MTAMTRMSAAFICSILVFIVCLILCSGPVQGTTSSGAETSYVSDVTAAGETTDVTQSEEHEAITRDLIAIVNHDLSLKSMLETSIAQTRALNPDPDTYPVSDLESYYAFLDRCYKAMPWEISPSETYSSLYDRIDQGMGCLYFICDQPPKPAASVLWNWIKEDMRCLCRWECVRYHPSTLNRLSDRASM